MTGRRSRWIRRGGEEDGGLKVEQEDLIVSRESHDVGRQWSRDQGANDDVRGHCVYTINIITVGGLIVGEIYDTRCFPRV